MIRSAGALQISTRVMYLVDLFIPEGVTEKAADKLVSHMAKTITPGVYFLAGESRVEVLGTTSFPSSTVDNGMTMISVQITVRADHQEGQQ